MSINGRIRHLRKEELKLSQREFAAKLHMAQTSVSDLEQEGSTVTERVIAAIVDKFHVSRTWLVFGTGPVIERKDQALDQLIAEYDLTEDDAALIRTWLSLSAEDRAAVLRFMKSVTAGEEPETWELPLFSLPAAAGTDSWDSGDVTEELVPVTTQPPPGADHLVRVSGDSMEPDYPDGALLFVKLTEDISPGQVGVFNVNGDEVVKEYQPGVLVSRNPARPDIVLREGDTARVQALVLGRV